MTRRFRDKVDRARVAHRAPAHDYRRPRITSADCLDRLAVLRRRSSCSITCMSVFHARRLDPPARRDHRLLTSIHPALVLLAVFAIPTVVASTRRPAIRRAAQQRGAQSARLGRHLFTTAATAPPARVRVLGIGDRASSNAARHWSGNCGGRVAVGARPGGMRSPGRFSAAATSVRWSLSRPAPDRRRGRAAGAGRRRAPVRRRDRQRIGFLRGMDGRLAAARMARRHAASLVATAIGPSRRRSRPASVSIACRSPIRAPRASCSTRSR